MKILLINKFLFPFGGTETSAFQTAELLREQGHEVVFFSMDHPKNRESRQSSLFVSRIDFEKMRGWRQKIRGVKRILFGKEPRAKLEEFLRIEKPDIAHLHNIYHHLSPAIISTLKKHGIPVVMTLHDYKVVCPAYKLFIHGKTCARCRRRRFAWCFLKKCVKDSHIKSLVCALEARLHRKYYNQVDCFISPSRFLQNKIGEMGFTRKCVHLPNFADMPPFEQPDLPANPIILFFGRLVEEKGIPVLIEAMQGISADCLIVGDGPMNEALEALALRIPAARIRFLGHQPFSALESIIRRSTMVVLPSIWFENNPFSILESFVRGIPVVASRIGGIPELIRDGETGLMFTPGDSGDLSKKIRFLLDRPEKIRLMGRNARRWVEEQNGRENHYSRLIEIYRSLTDGLREDPANSSRM